MLDNHLKHLFQFLKIRNLFKKLKVQLKNLKCLEPIIDEYIKYLYIYNYLIFKF